MDGVGRSRVRDSLDWLIKYWDKLQFLVMGAGWLYTILSTPMSPIMIIIFTLGCLVLVATFRWVINPLLDNALDGLIQLILHVVWLGFYFCWPIILEASPIVVLLLAENLQIWPWLLPQTTIAVRSIFLIRPVLGGRILLALKVWRSTNEGRTSVKGRYSIAKVPYQLYPVSCILLE